MKAIGILALVVLAVPALAGEPPHSAMKTASGWFDMENCEFCQSLVEDPALMDHMQWENHVISNGALSIAVVEPAYAAAYVKANAAMEALGQNMQTGKVDPTKVKMCGRCAAFGQLMMTGVKVETIKGEAAEVTLMTSGDPQVVAKIHEFTKRTNQEMAELMPAGHAN
jgi:hypothetical protein